MPKIAGFTTVYLLPVCRVLSTTVTLKRIEMFHICIFYIIVIAINLAKSSPHELCRSENGFIALSEDSKFLSVSKDKKTGIKTVFIYANQSKSFNHTV